MYNSQDVAERIKLLAQKRNVSVKQVLSDTGLGFNTMSNMKTSMPKSDNLAKIADYLNCSVDYLLGRTDNPNVTGSAYINGDNNNNGQQAINGNVTVNGKAAAPSEKKDTLTEQFMQKFEQLDFDDKVDVMQYVKGKNNT